jgi:hypothetical protein
MPVRSARIALVALLLAIYSTLGLVRPIANRLRDSGFMRITVAGCFVLTALLLAWLIFRRRENRRPRVLAGLGVVAIVYALVILPMDSPEEKIHFIEYGAVAVLASWSAPRSWSGRRRFAAALLFVTAAGWIDEGIQALLPSRFYDLRDVAFNATAGLIALAAMALCFPRERSLGPGGPEELAVDAVGPRPRGDR